MPALPGTIALANIPDGASIVAADHRNNYAAVQAAVNALIGVFSNGSLDGEAMVWDATNTKWVAASSLAAGRPRAPRMTVSTMAGGPPASPIDGDIWVATAVDANGTRWSFQYNAGSASALKWECIGGPAVCVIDDSSCATTNAAFGDPTSGTVGPSIVVARAGDYEIDVCGYMAPNTSQNAKVAISAAGSNTEIATSGGGANPAGQQAPYGAGRIRIGLTAGSTVKQVFASSSGSAAFVDRVTRVLPVRVS